MAEPLKNSFGPDVPVWIADSLAAVRPTFDRDGFLTAALDDFESLELTPRARQISAALADALPEDRAAALDLIVRALGPESAVSGLSGMEPFRYLPYVYFVADHGIGHFEESMRAQYELTKRFTAEFSIRAYVQHDPERTLARLAEWATDEDVHVRRLVSEGTRPRLPWAPRLKRFQEDPSPVLALLEMLKDDREEYVRRSVANNLNDISRDHPEVVVEIAERWWTNGSAERRKLVRHALRTLIKAGDPSALSVLGYDADSPASVSAVRCTPDRVAIGGKVRLEVDVSNPSEGDAGALVDLVVHFVKADGSARAKVFKGGELALGPGEAATIRKTVSLARHTTRTHYPGEHRVDVMVNGVRSPGTSFTVEAGD